MRQFRVRAALSSASPTDTPVILEAGFHRMAMQAPSN
jgi:hypothetical protein